MQQTWGVDLSTNPRHTSAVRVAWTDGAGRISEVITPLEVPRLAELIQSHPADTWGVDVPFGWPTGFTSFLAQHHHGPAAPAFAADSWASPFRLRRTDRSLTVGTPARRLNPLSVSHDRLGAVAVLWAWVEHALAAGSAPIRLDRSGMTGAVFETYPVGIRAHWLLPKKGAGNERAEVLSRLSSAHIDVTALVGSQPESTEHTWDAMLCALAARAHQLGDRPTLTVEEQWAADTEGWIHLPKRALNQLTGPI